MAADAHLLTKPRAASKIGINLIKVAALYLVGGISLGIVMGISHDFTLLSVHAHILLLGWATMVITGMVYIVLPACEVSRLAKAHSWALNTGLPVMILGLLLISLGHKLGEKIVGPGAFILLVAVVAFTVNVFLNGGRERRWSRDVNQ
jgi:hypothetical protein